MTEYAELTQKIDELNSQMTSEFIRRQVELLLQQGEDLGGGVNAYRLVRTLLQRTDLEDKKLVWAYNRLKPAFKSALEDVPSLYYFEGD